MAGTGPSALPQGTDGSSRCQPEPTEARGAWGHGSSPPSDATKPLPLQGCRRVGVSSARGLVTSGHDPSPAMTPGTRSAASRWWPAATCEYVPNVTAMVE